MRVLCVCVCIIQHRVVVIITITSIIGGIETCKQRREKRKKKKPSTTKAVERTWGGRASAAGVYGKREGISAHLLFPPLFFFSFRISKFDSRVKASQRDRERERREEKRAVGVPPWSSAPRPEEDKQTAGDVYSPSTTRTHEHLFFSLSFSFPVCSSAVEVQTTAAGWLAG